MKQINQYILEKLKINKDSQYKESNIDLLPIHQIGDLELPNNKKVLSRFLKGKEYKNCMDIYLSDNKKYIHIFRYSDMHHLELSLIYNDNSKWPDENIWGSKDKLLYNDLDDRDNMNNLFNGFYKFLKENIK